ncbi:MULTISPECIES: restriction endonuclease subunit S [Francisella]|nr:MULTISPECIES: restriction endonuclease subunit S [Francisella]APC92220.1 Type I restriction-modification system, specificity subunit S [Francisella sp. MA067296]
MSSLELPNGWRECKLDSLIEIKYGKDHKLLDDGDIPVYGSGGVMRYANQALYDKESILIPRKGTLGNIFYIDKPFWTVDTIFWSKIDSNKIFGKFLFYKLKTLDLASYNVGSAVPSLTTKILNEIEINLPPLAEQKAIAEVLSSLDDKIDLLHKQNQTLEDMAQTLFREWFIEKADEGWEEVPLSEIVYHRKDNVKPQNTPSGLFKHYSLPSFDNGKVPISETGSDIRSNKYRLYSYSILVSKLNPKTPRVWDIYFEVEDNEICSTEFQVLQPKKKEYFPFVSMFLKSNETTEILSMSASGTSGSHQRVTAKDMLSLKILKPCDSVILNFSEAVSPNFEKIHQNKKQIKTLEQTRDTLLPKLMSGQVRV